jgi:hypothetical protein
MSLSVRLQDSFHKILDFLSLKKPAYRLTFFGLITIAVALVPYSFLEKAHLSLYERAGIPAPSIGLTRAYWKFIHGDFVGAWQRNKLIYLVLCIVVSLIARDIYSLLRHKKV